MYLPGVLSPPRHNTDYSLHGSILSRCFYETFYNISSIMNTVQSYSTWIISVQHCVQISCTTHFTTVRTVFVPQVQPTTLSKQSYRDRPASIEWLRDGSADSSGLAGENEFLAARSKNKFLTRHLDFTILKILGDSLRKYTWYRPAWHFVKFESSRDWVAYWPLFHVIWF